MHIRPAQPSDSALLLSLWERSVRQTHTFLDEGDIAFYRPLVVKIFDGGSLELWVLTDDSDVPIGFIGLEGQSIEALFLDPAFFGRGGGRRLVAHAQALRGGALTVDVNEENAPAIGFYRALGFVVVARSALDDTGRPHPVLHMRRAAPQGECARQPGSISLSR